MDAQRREARWRSRRIIYNNDGDDVREPQNHRELTWQLLNRSGGELSDDFLDARSRPLLGTQVDSLWYSTCFSGLTFSHQTRVGDFYGSEVPQELVDLYGRDNLQIQTDFCHANGLEAFWSLRMNDTHDAYPEGIRTAFRELAPFKRDHPHCLMGQPGDWEKYPTGPKHEWTSLDFGLPEVRDHVCALIDEVCRGYDVDGVELDFYRAPRFFRPSMEGEPVEPQHVEAMTDLVRRIRRAADEAGQRRGRPLLLAMRAPMTVEKGLFIGLDLETWLAEDLVGEDLTSEGTIPRLRFRLHLWDTAANDDLCVKLNGELLDGLQAVGPVASTGSQWLECGLDAGRLRRGENGVELMLRQRDETMQQPLVVDAIQLHVHYE